MSRTLMHRSPRAEVGGRRRRLLRAGFYIHLWLGVLSTIALIAISITGILLNHKRGLGLMPDVPHQPTAPFAAALSLERLRRGDNDGFRGRPGAGDALHLRAVEAPAAEREFRRAPALADQIAAIVEVPAGVRMPEPGCLTALARWRSVTRRLPTLFQ